MDKITPEIKNLKAREFTKLSIETQIISLNHANSEPGHHNEIYK